MQIIFTKILSKILCLFPDRFIINVVEVLSPFLILVFNKNLKVFIKNNSVAFPRMSKKEIECISRATVVNRAINMLLGIKYSACEINKAQFKIETKQDSDFLTGVGKKPIIIIMPHLGANLITALCLSSTYKVNAFIPLRKTNNPAMDQYISQHYSRMLLKCSITGTNTMDTIDNVLKENGIAILLLDSVGNNKYVQKVSFFGKPFLISTTPLWLSKKYNASVYSISPYISRDGIINIEIFPQIKLENNIHDAEKLATCLEEMIEKHPGYWQLPDNYWVHVE